MTTTSDLDAPESDPTGQALQRTRVWATVLGGALLVMIGAGIALIFTAGNESQRADAYGGVLVDQNSMIKPLCEVAGPSVAAAGEQARRGCENVSRGLPAVPLPTDIAPPQKGDDGTGIVYTRQVDHCYVEVGLSNGTSSRFGPFCGADGSTGPTGLTGSSGPTGPTGESGAPGEPGKDAEPPVGIQDIRTDGCMVDVVLTDGSVRTVGPFCGYPPGEYTEVRQDGSEKHCTRDGGADTAPRYRCTTTAPTTGETTTTTVQPTENLPLPLPTG